MSDTVIFSGSGVLTQAIVDASIGSATIVIIEGYSSIGNNAFSNRTQIQSVTISDSVTNIGSNAFKSCSNLLSVAIPNSVTNIGTESFLGCNSLASVTIGDSVTNIGSIAFTFCSNLLSITIPNSVTNIGTDAFAYSGLTTVTISSATASTLGVPVPATNVYFFGQPGVTTVLSSQPPTIFFPPITATYGDYPTIIYYTSNSDGAVTFTSTNTLVATVSGQIITFLGAGESTITLNQSATNTYDAASVTTPCNVTANTSNNPTIITIGSELLYFLNDTTAENASIANDISVTDMLVSGNNRKVVLTSSNIVTINSV